VCVCLVSLTEAYFELSSFDHALCLSANIRRLELLNQFDSSTDVHTLQFIKTPITFIIVSLKSKTLCVLKHFQLNCLNDTKTFYECVYKRCKSSISAKKSPIGNWPIQSDKRI